MSSLITPQSMRIVNDDKGTHIILPLAEVSSGYTLQVRADILDGEARLDMYWVAAEKAANLDIIGLSLMHAWMVQAWQAANDVLLLPREGRLLDNLGKVLASVIRSFHGGKSALVGVHTENPQDFVAVSPTEPALADKLQIVINRMISRQKEVSHG